MSQAIALVRTVATQRAEPARAIIVLACAAALMLAERALPLL